jgi:nicotinate-nucleotide adenylyltransferase
MRRVGLLAGTFDPVHLGHVALAKAAMDQGGLDEVWLVVNPQAIKQDSTKVGLAVFEHRLAMARLATAAPRLGVYEGELLMRPHTWSTFEELAKRDGVDPVFVLGLDALLRIDRWDDVESVVAKATFMVAHRGTLNDGSLSELRQRLGALGKELKVRKFEFEGFDGVSSSQIKASLRKGERPAGLDPRVLEHILAERLYV